MFQLSGFQRSAFQIGYAIVDSVTAAGRARKRARKLTLQRARADQLAQKYNAALELKAEIELAKAVEPFVQVTIEQPKPFIDYEKIAADRKATKAFLKALEQFKAAVELEEHEIFEFFMAIA